MRAWLSTLLDVLQVLVAVVGFIISVVEAIYEGQTGAGAQKKEEALKEWTRIRDSLQKVVEEVLGERAAKVFGFLAQDKVVSIVIDVLVAYFNRTGFFPKGK